MRKLYNRRKKIVTLRNTMIAILDVSEGIKTTQLLEKLNDLLFQYLVIICHDRGSNLAGKENGLTGLMSKIEGFNFLDINDPCHSHYFMIKKVLEESSTSLICFIEALDRHFVIHQAGLINSKQRKKILPN